VKDFNGGGVKKYIAGGYQLQALFVLWYTR